jgi:hypothetical protein
LLPSYLEEEHISTATQDLTAKATLETKSAGLFTPESGRGALPNFGSEAGQDTIGTVALWSLTAFHRAAGDSQFQRRGGSSIIRIRVDCPRAEHGLKGKLDISCETPETTRSFTRTSVDFNR